MIGKFITMMRNIKNTLKFREIGTTKSLSIPLMTEGSITTAVKLEMVMSLLGGQPIYDEYGNPTGEVTPALITQQEAMKLLGFNEEI